MNPHIARLDQSLARSGEDIVLRRVVGTVNQVPVDVKCRAKIRPYGTDELKGEVVQGDQLVIISTTEIDRAQWPGGQPLGSPPTKTDPRIPRRGDKIIIGGEITTVQYPKPIRVGGVLVRMEIQVRG